MNRLLCLITCETYEIPHVIKYMEGNDEVEMMLHLK